MHIATRACRRHHRGFRNLSQARTTDHPEIFGIMRFQIMTSHMPSIPPANRNKNPGIDPEVSKDNCAKQPEKHHNGAEEGDTANIKQNTTNKGFFRGRRMG
jgi:hypothetical protein